MSATKAQRVGIWIIAAFMFVGTIGSFAIIVLANSNAQSDQARYNQLLGEYQAATKAQEAELSNEHKEQVAGYKSRVGEFDAASVTELKTEDLAVGTGDDLTSESSFTAYYIGWNPKGVIFDSSINDDGSLKAPFTAAPGQVITGWTEGVNGMKVGGVRELSIPSDKAYGETGSGENIPPNTPLKFVIITIPTPKTIEIPQELLTLSSRLYGN